MKFGIEPKQASRPSGTEITPTVESISEAYEGLMASYMELTDAQRNLDEVCQAVANVELSIQMLKVGGDAAVSILNVDKSLESLLNLDAKLITANRAQEGLVDTAKDLFHKFVEWIKKVIAKIKEFWKHLTDKRFVWLSFVKKTKKVLVEKGAQKWNVFRKAEDDDYVPSLIKYDDFMNILGKFGDVAGALAPALMKIQQEATKIDRVIGQSYEEFVKWNDEMIKLIGDTIRDPKLNGALNSVGTFLKVSDEGIVKMYQFRVIRDMPSIFGGTQDISGTEYTEYFRPVDSYDDKTLGELGWTYENALKAADATIAHYSKFGEFGATYANRSDEINAKFMTAVSKIEQSNTKMLTAVKTSFGSITSFYRVAMEIHDYGFHYFLKWVMNLAYGSEVV